MQFLLLLRFGSWILLHAMGYNLVYSKIIEIVRKAYNGSRIKYKPKDILKYGKKRMIC